MSSESDEVNPSSERNFDATAPSELVPSEPQLSELLAVPIAVPPPALIPCRRCGKIVPETLPSCPFCDARLPGGRAVPTSLLAPIRAQPEPVETSVTHTAINRLLIFYLILLSTNLFGGWIISASVNSNMDEKQIEALVLPLMVGTEIIDGIIVLLAIYAIPRPPRVGPWSARQRQIGWLMGPVVLAVVLGLNFGYHALIQKYVQFPDFAKSGLDLPIGWAIITVCIQPGIVEELFFRYAALGTLTRVMGVGGAICVSSIMFGMAHSSVALSIPILTVVGAGLGLVRVWSGSMILPMLLHALHNSVVLYLESAK